MSSQLKAKGKSYSSTFEAVKALHPEQVHTYQVSKFVHRRISSQILAQNDDDVLPFASLYMPIAAGLIACLFCSVVFVASTLKSDKKVTVAALEKQNLSPAPYSEGSELLSIPKDPEANIEIESEILEPIEINDDSHIIVHEKQNGFLFGQKVYEIEFSGKSYPVKWDVNTESDDLEVSLPQAEEKDYHMLKMPRQIKVQDTSGKYTLYGTEPRVILQQIEKLNKL